MVQWVSAAVVTLSFVASLVIFSRRYGRQPTPRRIQQVQRRNFYLIAVMCCFFLPLMILQQQWLAVGWWVIMIVSIAYNAFRPPSPKDMETNYAVDDGHCGQCGYDLTGNVSGMCPECGWSIPISLTPRETPAWPMWWMRWDIEYLENWRKTLASTVFFLLAFLGLAVWFVLRGTTLFVALPLIMMTQFVINTVRVMRYARHERNRLSPHPPAHDNESDASPESV